MNGNNTWPIKPKQISNDFNLGFSETGIIPNMYLKGILSDMTTETNYPITFCEHCSNQVVNTHGDTSKIWHDQKCLGADCNEKNCIYYETQKRIISKNLCDLKKNRKILSYEDWESIMNNILTYSNKPPKEVSFDNKVVRIYGYKCYKNKLNEYSIPIIFHGSLLGVLFAGMINDENDFIDKIIPEIKKLYAILEYELEKKSINFIAQKVEDVNRLLRDEFYKNPLPSHGLRLKRFWSKIQLPLNKFREHFPAKHIVIFAKDTMENADFDSNFKAVIGSGINLKYQDIFYSPSQVDNYDEMSKSTVLNITSKNYPNLLNGLSLGNYKWDEDADILRLFPSNYSPRSAFLIWIRYDIEVWDRIGESKNDARQDELFEIAILSFYSLMGSIYSSVMAEIASELLELTIRVMGHEISQNLVVIEAIRYFNIETGNIIDNPGKLSAINDDLASQVTQIEYMDLNARAIIKKDTKLNIDSIHPLKDLIYKWVNTYRRKSRLRKIQFKTQDFNPGYRMPVVTTDSLKLDQVVYNIINNAWKYCYKGTNIIIWYGRHYNAPNSVRISIKNYSKTIPPDNRDIYDLFERGDDTEGIEGLGVGLGIARQHMKLLNGKVYHKCDKEEDKLSDYNIPVLSYYIETVSPRSKIENHNKLIEEYSRLNNLDENIFEKVVCRNNKMHVYQPSLDEIIHSINYPTYQIEFIVELPIILNK